MSSPLAKAIERAKACQASGTQFVTSVSIDPAVAIAALTIADGERRDFSNLIEVILASHAKDQAAPAPEFVELLGKLQSALTERPALKPKLEKFLRANLRTATA